SVNLRAPVVAAGPSMRPQRLPLCLGGRGLQRDAELGRAQIWEQARHSDKQRLLRRAHADQAGDFSGHWGGVEHGQLLVLSGFLVPVGVFDVSCHSSISRMTFSATSDGTSCEFSVALSRITR